MCCRCNGYIVFCYVYAQRHALVVDVGEVVLGLFGVLVRYVEIYAFVAAHLHFVVDGSGNYVARGERAAFVVFLHELLAVFGAEYGSVAAHGFGYEKAGAFSGVVQRGGVELYEFHVFYFAFGTVNHSYSVACGYRRVGGGAIYVAYSSGGYKGRFRQERVYVVGVLVEYIYAVTGNVGGVAGYVYPQMVLGYQLYGEGVFEYFYLGVFL